MSDTAQAAVRRPRWRDRVALLASIDLANLADQLLPGGKGRGRSRSWPCPAPSHGPQTGRTPPVSMFLGRDGIPRWSCHGFACDAGGTAVDLVMVTQQRTAAEALRYLAGVTGSSPLPAPPSPPAAHQKSDEIPHPALVIYVDRCQQLLWSDRGMPGRNLLERRELSKEVLHANRIGYDPGPGRLPRRSGLPRRGPGIVLPVLDDRAEPRYLQVRYLDPVDGRRYDNPTEELVGPSPRVAFTRLAGADADQGTALVCEGILDALSAVQAGYTAAAVLGNRAPDEGIAQALLERFHGRRLVLAFDDDDAGRGGAARLAALLAERGAGDRIDVLRPRHGDLNEWLQHAREDFPAQLRADVKPAAGEVYRVQLLQAPPANTGARHEHLGSFDVPARQIDAATQRRGAAGDPAAASIVAAEAALALGQHVPAKLGAGPDGLARDRRRITPHSIAVGDVVVVTAPDRLVTTLAYSGAGWQPLGTIPPFRAAPHLEAVPASGPPAGPSPGLAL